MKRSLLVALAVSLVALVAVAATVRPSAPATPVYSVAQVTAGLQHHPQAWVGRIVTVRGTPIMITWTVGPNGASGGDGCIDGASCDMHAPTRSTLHLFVVADGPYNSATTYTLLRESVLAQHRGLTFTPSPPAPPPNLVLRGHIAAPNPALLFLARLPLIGPLFPSMTTVRGATPRVYRIRLMPAPRSPCTQQPVCDDGALLDTLH